MSKSFPKISELSKILLRKTTGEEFLAKELWQDSPLVLVGIRRPGCLLCREEAVKLWQMKEEFDKTGTRLVCVVHEWVEREVNGFHPEFWPGELYHDFNKDVYKALGGGQVRRGSMLSMLNPFSQAWKNINKAKSSGLVKDHNLNGEGMIMGGLLVLKKGDGGVVFLHSESTFGDHPDHQAVLEAAKKAAGAS